MNRVAYCAGSIFTGESFEDDKAVLAESGWVKDLVPFSGIPSGYLVRQLENAVLVPAFIDLQIYGANKKLFSAHTTIDALYDLYIYCTGGGACVFLPTVATNSKEVFYKAIDVVRAYWLQGGKGVGGVHLEGPWINKKKRGAHLEEFIHAPDANELTDLLEHGKDVIKMITLAPEVCTPEIISTISKSGIIVSAGHSDCSFREGMNAFDMGIPAATHLFNAMSPLQHREPGLVGACFQHPQVQASIIADGYHVQYEAISIAKKIMGDRLFAITDAVTDTNEGPYRHTLEEDRYTCNGTLSGSALTMHQSFVNLVERAGVDKAEALRMCSLYPARLMGWDNTYGRIAPGFAAQFAVLDRQLGLVDVVA
jgi:N-acetylglucosamine-6-phosphate deacetylase